MRSSFMTDTTIQACPCRRERRVDCLGWHRFFRSATSGSRLYIYIYNYIYNYNYGSEPAVSQQ